MSALLAVSVELLVRGQGFVWPASTAIWLALAGNGLLGYGNQASVGTSVVP